MEEIRVDMRQRSQYDLEEYSRQEELLFRLNQTFPRSEEYSDILQELFKNRIGEGSFLRAPLAGAAIDKMTIGKRCFSASRSTSSRGRGSEQALP